MSTLTSPPSAFCPPCTLLAPHASPAVLLSLALLPTCPSGLLGPHNLFATFSQHVPTTGSHFLPVSFCRKRFSRFRCGMPSFRSSYQYHAPRPAHSHARTCFTSRCEGPKTYSVPVSPPPVQAALPTAYAFVGQHFAMVARFWWTVSFSVILPRGTFLDGCKRLLRQQPFFLRGDCFANSRYPLRVFHTFTGNCFANSAFPLANPRLAVRFVPNYLHSQHLVRRRLWAPLPSQKRTGPYRLWVEVSLRQMLQTDSQLCSYHRLTVRVNCSFLIITRLWNLGWGRGDP